MAAQDSAPFTPSTVALLGQTLAMAALRAQIQHLAAFDTIGNPYAPTVLLQGETGTGKGLVAQLMHASGPRAHGPFLHVNCAALPDHLLEAELFGFEAGAFTDARRAKPGLFEAAIHGTLFLDEVDALPLPLQGKLLTVIEDKQVRRLGAVTARTIDVKLIAATQVELPTLVTAGRFRADLFHRLAVVLLRLPPLRERQADIVLLAQHFLRQYATAHGLTPKRLTPAAVAWLQNYPWPGNVRELSHVMERIILLHPETVLDAAAMEQWCLPQPGIMLTTASGPATDGSAPLDEPARLRQALSQTGGNVARGTPARAEPQYDALSHASVWHYAPIGVATIVRTPVRIAPADVPEGPARRCRGTSSTLAVLGAETRGGAGHRVDLPGIYCIRDCRRGSLDSGSALGAYRRRTRAELRRHDHAVHHTAPDSAIWCAADTRADATACSAGGPHHSAPGRGSAHARGDWALPAGAADRASGDCPG